MSLPPKRECQRDQDRRTVSKSALYPNNLPTHDDYTRCAPVFLA